MSKEGGDTAGCHKSFRTSEKKLESLHLGQWILRAYQNSSRWNTNLTELTVQWRWLCTNFTMQDGKIVLQSRHKMS